MRAPPPHDRTYFAVSVGVFVLALLVLICFCAWTSYDSALSDSPTGRWLRYW